MQHHTLAVRFPEARLFAMGMLIWLLGGATLASDPCALGPFDPLPPPSRGGPIIDVDFDGDSTSDCRYEVASDGVSASIYTFLRRAGVVNLIASSNDRVGFMLGELVGLAGQKPYTSPGVPNGMAILIQFWSEDCPPFGCWNYGESEGMFAQDTEAWVGFRLHAADGPHHGWVKFVRPCTKPWVPFTLDSYALHPLPNTPIPAGIVPQPDLSITHEGGQVTLSWPAGWQGWQLEWQPVLKPSVAWKPVEGVANNRVTLPADWPAAFFRLVTPAPSP